RAKDDADITVDLAEPRSQSGRYWKQAHEDYAAKSERETRKLIAKQKLAKEFAKKKDAEATELKLRLDSERKQYGVREKSWEASMKDMQDRLRNTIAENGRYAAELALLRQRLESSSKGTARELPELSIEGPTTTQESGPDRSHLKLPDSTPKRSSPKAEEIASIAPVVSATPSPRTPRGGTVGSAVPTPQRSSRPAINSPSYHVTTRPVTVTTARVRSASRKEEEHAPISATSATDGAAGPAESSDLDIWAISEADLAQAAPQPRSTARPSRRPREALQPRSGNSAAVVADLGSASPRAPAQMGTGTPQHFPGARTGAGKVHEPSVASAKSKLPPSKEEAARARIAARRARKGGAGVRDKENVASVLSTLLST
ncbi:MAG: hypothetical protein INR71_14150, partial [Terriglobus roseus]|nr:hypothetical protein [Terriglobus roseus]